MEDNNSVRNAKQALFREMVLGTLVYSVVLGFFNDYTDILKIRSYSITFLAAIVMQILTHITFWLKKKVAGHFKNKQHKYAKLGLVFGVWAIMFFSKFVFLAVIDVIFGNLVQISGFVGLLTIIISMSLIKFLIDYVYNRLAD